MRDDFRAQGLQSMYHAGAVGALNALAEECTSIAFILVKTICKKKGLHFSREHMEEYAHDAAALVIARYLKCPDYSIRRYYSVIWGTLQTVMFDGHRRKQKSFEDRQLSLLNNKGSEYKQREPINLSTAFDELATDHPKGKRIVMDLACSTSYAKAIRRIAAYVGREWVYEHAEKLHTVFKTFKWKPNKARHISGNGSGQLSHTVLQVQQREQEQDHE